MWKHAKIFKTIIEGKGSYRLGAGVYSARFAGEPGKNSKKQLRNSSP